MKLIRLASIFILLLCTGTALAGEAVSGLNGKMAFSYGDMDSNRGKNVTGSLSVPLSKHFGLQADGLYSHVSKRDFYGAGIQLFWRDSNKGLLGVSIAGVHQNDMDSYMGGVMGEYYMESFTLGLNAGYAMIKYDIGPVPFINTDETDPYVGGSVGMYPIEDLLIEASYIYSFDNHLFQCTVEYQTPVNGLSVFADLAKGDQDYDQSLFGIRYYFGKQKSLKRRHREDDPQNIVAGVLNNIGTYGAEYNNEAKEYNEKAKAYNESLLSNPLITPSFYSSHVMPVYESSYYGCSSSEPYGLSMEIGP